MARFTVTGGGGGAPGPQGPAGESAYDIAVENGFTGTEQEWLDSIGGTANTGNFVFNGNSVSTDEDMTIGVNGVPGKINLSAYLGIDLSFAQQQEGAGLRFPDNTVQTTAYTGGAESPKTWIAPNESLYQINQAHGGTEIQLSQPQSWGESVTVSGNFTNSNSMNIVVSPELNAIFSDISSSVQYFRRILVDMGQETRYFILNNQIMENVWNIYTQNGNFSAYDQGQYYLQVEYGGAPVKWWDAHTLGIMPEGEEWKFRGAKIEYHAYSQDAGTMIGTIYIASDNGDANVTHIETGSGANDLGNVVLWNRYGNEAELYAYRVDNEDDTVKIHWTAQVYYGTEYYD